MDNNGLPQGFQLDEPATSPPQANTDAGAGATGDLDLPAGFQLDAAPPSDNLLEQVKAGAEGAGRGFAGPLSTGFETKVLGVNPQDILRRQYQYPWTSELGEAAGFGAGALTGTGEAGLVGHLGELAAGAAGLGEAATTGAKLAKGALTAATEFGLIQSGDETSKWILNAPQTPGSVVANIGLAALLGGVGGGALTGAGLTAMKALDSVGLKEFADRLAFRASNIDPNEMMRNEAENVVSTYNKMNDEIGGATGLRAQAIQNLLPDSLTPEIGNQVQDIATKSEDAIKQMVKDQVPPRYIGKFESDANNFLQTVTDPNATVSDHFDALNTFKRNLQDYSKGNWGPFAVPRYHEAYDFINTTKNLSRDIRLGLENSDVWGDAATLQKNLNASWTKALPAMKDFERKFMTNVGGEPVISADKFATYARQGAKATTTTDRQAMMGNFINAMDNHFNTVDRLYNAADIENPFPAVGMGALKESINKQSPWVRAADLWHDKISADSIGQGLGMGVAGAAAHAIGIPGIEGVYFGRWVLGHAFGSLLKPIMEKYPNVDIGAVQHALSVAEAVRKGDGNMVNAARSLFSGAAKTFPDHIIPKSHDIEKLDNKTSDLGKDDSVAKMQNVSGKIGYYLPGHETEIAKTASSAITYLNSQRPQVMKQLPLDGDGKPSEFQNRQYKQTLMIAQQPLMAFKFMRDGTLTNQDITTIKTLYPAYYNKMSQQLMQSMADHVHKDGYIPYQTKQMMSLFLGQPLDSTMTPNSIQSVQNIYAQANMQKAMANAAQARPPRKKAAKLTGAADNHFTQNQAAINRQREG